MDFYRQQLHNELGLPDFGRLNLGPSDSACQATGGDVSMGEPVAQRTGRDPRAEPTKQNKREGIYRRSQGSASAGLSTDGATAATTTTSTSTITRQSPPPNAPTGPRAANRSRKRKSDGSSVDSPGAVYKRYRHSTLAVEPSGYEADDDPEPKSGRRSCPSRAAASSSWLSNDNNYRRNSNHNNNSNPHQWRRRGADTYRPSHGSSANAPSSGFSPSRVPVTTSTNRGPSTSTSARTTTTTTTTSQPPIILRISKAAVTVASPKPSLRTEEKQAAVELQAILDKSARAQAGRESKKARRGTIGTMSQTRGVSKTRRGGAGGLSRGGSNGSGHRNNRPSSSSSSGVAAGNASDVQSEDDDFPSDARRKTVRFSNGVTPNSTRGGGGSRGGGGAPLRGGLKGGRATMDAREKRFSTTDKTELQQRLDHLNSLRPAERQEAVKKGYLAPESGKMRLEDARPIVGSCEDMCPERERLTRILQRDVWLPEYDPDTLDKGPSQRVPSEARMVKRFKRSAAGDEDQLPSDLRPPHILVKTLDYLVNDLIKESGLATVHHFIWDRTRAIRNDFSIQQVEQPRDVKLAINTFERIIRFHIVSMHVLGTQVKPYDSFDEQQEWEQCTKTSISLYEYYKTAADKFVVNNEAEFIAYRVIREIGLIKSNLPKEYAGHTVEDPLVRGALSLYAAAADLITSKGALPPLSPETISQTILGKFWQVARSPDVPFLMACMAEQMFPRIRYHIMYQIWKSFRQNGRRPTDVWTLPVLKDVLACNDEEQTRSICECWGFKFGKTDNDVFFLELQSVVGTLSNKQPEGAYVFSNLVESKRPKAPISNLINGTTGKSIIVELDTDMEEESLFVTDDEAPTKPNLLSKPPTSVPAMQQPSNGVFTPLNPSATVFQPTVAPSTTSWGQPSGVFGAASTAPQLSDGPNSIPTSMTAVVSGAAAATNLGTAPSGPFSAAASNGNTSVKPTPGLFSFLKANNQPSSQTATSQTSGSIAFSRSPSPFAPPPPVASSATTSSTQPETSVFAPFNNNTAVNSIAPAITLFPSSAPAFATTATATTLAAPAAPFQPTPSIFSTTPQPSTPQFSLLPSTASNQTPAAASQAAPTLFPSATQPSHQAPSLPQFAPPSAPFTPASNTSGPTSTTFPVPQTSFFLGATTASPVLQAVPLAPASIPSENPGSFTPQQSLSALSSEAALAPNTSLPAGPNAVSTSTPPAFLFQPAAASSVTPTLKQQIPAPVPPSTASASLSTPPIFNFQTPAPSTVEKAPTLASESTDPASLIAPSAEQSASVLPPAAVEGTPSVVVEKIPEVDQEQLRQQRLEQEKKAKDDIFQSVAEQLLTDPKEGIMFYFIEKYADQEIRAALKQFEEEQRQEQLAQERALILASKYWIRWRDVLQRNKRRRRGAKRRERVAQERKAWAERRAKEENQRFSFEDALKAEAAQIMHFRSSLAQKRSSRELDDMENWEREQQTDSKRSKTRPSPDGVAHYAKWKRPMEVDEDISLQPKRAKNSRSVSGDASSTSISDHHRKRSASGSLRRTEFLTTATTTTTHHQRSKTHTGTTIPGSIARPDYQYLSGGSLFGHPALAPTAPISTTKSTYFRRKAMGLPAEPSIEPYIRATTEASPPSTNFTRESTRPMLNSNLSPAGSRRNSGSSDTDALIDRAAAVLRRSALGKTSSPSLALLRSTHSASLRMTDVPPIADPNMQESLLRVYDAFDNIEAMDKEIIDRLTKEDEERISRRLSDTQAKLYPVAPPHHSPPNPLKRSFGSSTSTQFNASTSSPRPAYWGRVSKFVPRELYGKAKLNESIHGTSVNAQATQMESKPVFEPLAPPPPRQLAPPQSNSNIPDVIDLDSD